MIIALRNVSAYERGQIGILIDARSGKDAPRGVTFLDLVARRLKPPRQRRHFVLQWHGANQAIKILYVGRRIDLPCPRGEEGKSPPAIAQRAQGKV